MTKKLARLTEVFDDGGNMLRIVAVDAESDEHIIDALWDPTDEQNETTRAEFRAWAARMLARKGYDPIN